MDERIQRALSRGHRIDITTTGRRTGAARRIEIVFHNFAGRLYITGSPSRRKRAWLLNLEADPHMTFHLKGAVTADLAATARIITEEAERRAILTEVVKVWNRMDLEAMTSLSPLIEVTIDEPTA
jgi:deazaflavin-dependent oxidoreductase (nitroreductase family)